MLKSLGYPFLTQVAAVTWSTLSGKPSTFPPSAHGHPYSDITGTPAIPAASNANPQALGTAAPGVSADYSRSDHVHPVPTLYPPLAFTGSVAETGLVLLALSVRRVPVTVAGAIVGASYQVIPTSAPPAGFSIQDAYCAVAGTIQVGVLVPIITGNYSIPVKIFRLA